MPSSAASPMTSSATPTLGAAAPAMRLQTATPPAAAVATAALGAQADLVLMGGKVITVDLADSIVQAVAIKGGLIQAVGANEAVRAWIGDKTVVLDLRGKAVTPGLIDPHNHLQVMGLTQGFFQPYLPPEVRSIKELQARLAETVAKTPRGEWVKGYYLSMSEGRMPNKKDLDPVSPEHPVWLMQQGGHYGSANSAALRVAGITASTADPVGGVIERDARGEPTGVFYNHRAMDLLRRHMPSPTLEMAQENIVSPQSLFAACGVTSFQDNNVRGVETVQTYLDMGRQGKMYLRGVVYYTLEWPADLERALKEIKPYQDPFMRFAGFKFLIDGQAQMAYCHQPHNGVRWNVPTWEPRSFKAAVRALHDAGLQICVHCIGDAAVDLTLDAYEEAMKANPRPDPRHRIEHCVLCTPQSVQRMKALGVVVSTQPQFIRMGGEHWVSVFGQERTRRAIVTREWLQAGVPVALGSDAPTTPWYTPQVTLAGAVTRSTASNRIHEPEQSMTIQEALRAHTLVAAYAAHEEKLKGSIEPGKLADLVVWGEDPYTAPSARLWQIPVSVTIVGGRIVYQA